MKYTSYNIDLLVPTAFLYCTMNFFKLYKLYIDKFYNDAHN